MKVSDPMGQRRRSWPRRWFRLSVLLALPFLASCSTVAGPSDLADGPPPPGTGVLTGNVLRGPVTSVVVVGSNSSTPVAGAKVIASKPGGGPEVASASTDGEGAYRVFLPSGTYVVTVGAGTSFLFSKDLPATVSVTEGQTTILNVMLDTGIR